jgi:hypothetical protein
MINGNLIARTNRVHRVQDGANTLRNLINVSAGLLCIAELVGCASGAGGTVGGGTSPSLNSLSPISKTEGLRKYRVTARDLRHYKSWGGVLTTPSQQSSAAAQTDS